MTSRHLHERTTPAEVDAALRAVADLLAPEPDLHVVDRDALGTLLRVLCIVREVLAEPAR